jgi:nucleotide-binding universal stress UspA family protein
MQFRNVLVAFDGSAPAERAIVMADELAGRQGARMILVTVLEPVAASQFPTGFEYPSAAEHDAARSQLERQAGELRAKGRQVETQVEIGNPAQMLLDLAGRFEADLIVTGRSGKGAVARVIMGSVTTALLHRTSKPMVVVP